MTDEPPPSRPEPGLHGRPTAVELIEAVREFLAGDVLAATEGRVKFHARVAANALAMVERELVAGEGPALDHRHRLETLGVHSDGELGAAIRDGHLDDRWDEVVQVVEAAVRARLDVANPRYRN